MIKWLELLSFKIREKHKMSNGMQSTLKSISIYQMDF